MRIRAIKAYCCVIGLVFIAYYGYAQRKVFTFSADTTTASLAKGEEFTLLSGNAKVIVDDVKITAQEIKLYGDDFQYAEVTGNFTAYDQKNKFSLSGISLLYDRQRKLLRSRGNIKMKDEKNDVVIRAGFLESKEDGRFMIVQLGVRITKKDELSARSEFLTYYRDTEELQMSGFPYALWKDDEYRANRITINLDTDSVILEGKVSGSISTVESGADSSSESSELIRGEDKLVAPQ